MMKIYTIVSTYPEHGSKNIGDSLISASTIEAVKYIKGKDVSFNIIWRAASWEDVKSTVLGSDAVIFACLAIRKNMNSTVYPYLNNIIDARIPFGVISSGTSLSPLNNDVVNDIDEESVAVLKKATESALFFTTRGYLTQYFCDKHKINSTFSGDIAFFDPRFSNRTFVPAKPVKKIAVSDPHYADYFLPAFVKLIQELREAFPKSEISVLLHGINPEIENYCTSKNVSLIKIYEDKENGLDKYDEFDLHVGFRIHAHVSALTRRKYSYLLEQDGRGIDYGLTIDKKISVNSVIAYSGEVVAEFPAPEAQIPVTNILSRLFRKQVVKIASAPVATKHVNTASVDYLMSVIKQDAESNYEKFTAVNDQILDFNSKCLEALSKLP